MDIIALFPPYIYSIQYDGQSENEFDRLLTEWNDLDKVLTFLEENKGYLTVRTWEKISEPFVAANQILKEAERLEVLFDSLLENTKKGEEPDFDCHFKYLDGKYRFETELGPMKSYGDIYPSLLRIYAIKLNSNTYLITGGGIKLADTIQNSPLLKDHVIQNIDKVRRYLQMEGILDNEDLNNI